LALLRTVRAGASAVALEGTPPVAGALAVGVGHWGGQRVATPVFFTHVSRGEFRLTVDAALLPGMPIFTITGGLLAIVGNAPDASVAYPVSDAATRLLTRAAVNDQRPSVGIALQAITEPLRAVFSEGAVVITEVIDGSPADRAGIRVGDVLQAVGTAAIDSVDAAARALRETKVGAPVVLHLWRAGRPVSIETTPESAFDAASRARAAEPTASPRAAELLSADMLARSGIPGSAAVVALNGRVVTSRAQVDLELRRAKRPLPILVRVGDQQFFVAVERQP
jgi:hypothetical protein